MSAEATHTFEHLKQAMASAPVLALMDYSKLFEAETMPPLLVWMGY